MSKKRDYKGKLKNVFTKVSLVTLTGLMLLPNGVQIAEAMSADRLEPIAIVQYAQDDSKNYVDDEGVFSFDMSTIQQNNEQENIAPSVQTVAPSNAVKVPAVATASKVLVDGKQVSFDAYNIKDNNYFKLRDIAYVLNGTGKQFSVDWNGNRNAIDLKSGGAYIAVGGEMTQATGNGKKEATLTTASVYLDGKLMQVTAYNIEGNNYFKLRDLGSAINFGVDWDGKANLISISSTKGYTPESNGGVVEAPKPGVTNSGAAYIDNIGGVGGYGSMYLSVGPRGWNATAVNQSNPARASGYNYDQGSTAADKARMLSAGSFTMSSEYAKFLLSPNEVLDASKVNDVPKYTDMPAYTGPALGQAPVGGENRQIVHIIAQDMGLTVNADGSISAPSNWTSKIQGAWKEYNFQSTLDKCTYTKVGDVYVVRAPDSWLETTSQYLNIVTAPTAEVKSVYEINSKATECMFFGVNKNGEKGVDPSRPVILLHGDVYDIWKAARYNGNQKVLWSEWMQMSAAMGKYKTMVDSGANHEGHAFTMRPLAGASTISFGRFDDLVMSHPNVMMMYDRTAKADYYSNYLRAINPGLWTMPENIRGKEGYLADKLWLESQSSGSRTGIIEHNSGVDFVRAESEQAGLRILANNNYVGFADDMSSTYKIADGRLYVRANALGQALGALPDGKGAPFEWGFNYLGNRLGHENPDGTRDEVGKTVYLNGKQFNLSYQYRMQAGQPGMQDDYVDPLVVCNLLGIGVSWDAKTQTLVIGEDQPVMSKMKYVASALTGASVSSSFFGTLQSIQSKASKQFYVNPLDQYQFGMTQLEGTNQDDWYRAYIAAPALGIQYNPDVSADLFSSINSFRQGKGLSALTFDFGYQSYELYYNAYLAYSGNFMHATDFQLENLTKFTGKTAEEAAQTALKNWIDSPAHLGLLMNKSVTHMGVVVYQYNGTWYAGMMCGNGTGVQTPALTQAMVDRVNGYIY